jgi:hypothetical protein
VQIPRKLSHIWIGPRTPPTAWMQSWRDKHPDWDYTLYDNAYLAGTTFRNRAILDEYLRRGEYAGAADIMRYEILYRTGGFMPEADSICLENTEELFPRACAYTVYENEFLRGQLVSPILACEPGNPFVGQLVDALARLRPADLDRPWMTTGNKFVAEMIERCAPDIVIFPSYTFIPVHVEGRAYKGDGKVYARQLFGETRGAYGKKPGGLRLKERLQKWRSSRARRRLKRNRDQSFGG